MKMLIAAAVVVLVAAVTEAAYVSPKNGRVVYLPEHKGIVSLADAKKYCQDVGGFLPHNFNVTERNLIGTLFTQATNKTFWIDAFKGSDNQYRWTETQTIVASDLWKQSEPQGDGNVVLQKDTAVATGPVGLYVYTQKTDNHLTVCQIDLSSKQQIQLVHKLWQKLPYEDLEPLEKMLIETHFNDPMTSVKAKLEDLDKRTGVLLRLVQKLIEDGQ